MSKIEQLLLQDVSPGDILANDLFVDRQLLMKKDSTLTAKGIELLKKKGVQFVSIYYQEKSTVVDNTTQHSDDLSEKNDIVFNFSNIPSIIHSTEDDNVNLSTLLAELDIDIRYGQILKDESAIDYLQDLLNEILSSPPYKKYLKQLKVWDYTSYLHSIDAFILGTLFARKLNIEQLEQIAIGYLLHDIGKLNIPQAILQKPGRLNEKEFDIMKLHTVEGESIFHEIGLSQLAYLAKSHHERRNGEGYPSNNSTTFTIELEILQIIDVYSAITMKRAYRDAMRAADAFSLLYRDQELFNEQLLTQFVDFIGIYPENSIVLLSDNLHGIVEKTNLKFPTSPRVKCIETGVSFHISLNNNITISKMISHQSEDKAVLLNTFYNELVSANVENAKKTYLKLVDNFKVSEYFTKIFIPVYQILNLLKREQAIYDSKYAQVMQYMEQMMERKIKDVIDNDHYEQNVLFIVDSTYKEDYLFNAFLGLVHNERIYPHVLTIDSSIDSILMTVKSAQISKVCVITDSPTNTFSSLSYLPDKVEISFNQIERYLISLIGEAHDVFQFESLLQNNTTNKSISI